MTTPVSFTLQIRLPRNQAGLEQLTKELPFVSFRILANSQAALLLGSMAQEDFERIFTAVVEPKEKQVDVPGRGVERVPYWVPKTYPIVPASMEPYIEGIALSAPPADEEVILGFELRKALGLS